MTQDDAGMAGAGAVFRKQRRRETLAFCALAFGIWPIVAVGVVGGYGLAVWIWQIIFGPPGPPAS
jgi:periplasmic nitrate reductase NapE